MRCSALMGSVVCFSVVLPRLLLPLPASQFYDHYYDWGHKKAIQELISVRKRNCIHTESSCSILVADADLYIASIDDKVIVKLGPRFELGSHTPDPQKYRVAAFGNEFCVWERKDEDEDEAVKAE